MPRNQTPKKHPHAKLITDLGGPAKLAAKLTQQTGEDLERETVSNWQKRGISHRWRPTVAILARNMEVKLPQRFLHPAG